MADYWKYHGLGNDYLVIEAEQFAGSLTAEAARKICDRTRGIGADGILLAAGDPPQAVPDGDGDGADPGFPVRIINPDGSEAEKSGNGLRIFARFLWERAYAREPRFTISVAGQTVLAEVLDPGGSPVALEMGRVSFASGDIPMGGPPREVLREPLVLGGEEWSVSAANLGNPHCVVEVEEPTPELARRVGPMIEKHHLFPNRTNVQFMTPVDQHRIRIEIWERGAGYTLSSGTSSCASAAVACRLGLCRSPVTVITPGGPLKVTLTEKGQTFHARLEGEVAAVGQGFFSDQFLDELGLRRTGGGPAPTRAPGDRFPR